MKKVTMTDKEFSEYLFKTDKNWTYKKSESDSTIPYCTYFDSRGNVIALVFCDDKKCTRRIFI